VTSIGALIKLRPRSAAALAFGISTAALTHFAWYPDARMSGMVPALTLGAGLAHAVAGAITGSRLVDVRRTRTSSHAALLGAGTSLLAMVFFTVLLSVYVSVTDRLQSSALGYLVMTLFTGLFAFLGAGWALLLVSVGVGWGLYQLASLAAVP
jgi:hypothetical protein